MGMTKVAGTELSTGCLNLTGMVAQNVTKQAGGELREYRNEAGNVFSLYLYDGHTKISFEGLLPADQAATLKTKGSTIVITEGQATTTYYIEDYQIAFTNNDVSKVSGSARTYPDLASSGTTTSTTSGNGNT